MQYYSSNAPAVDTQNAAVAIRKSLRGNGWNVEYSSTLPAGIWIFGA